MWDIAYDGIGVNCVTMKAGDTIEVSSEGMVGKVSANDTIDLCEAEDRFYGKISKVEKAAGILTIDREGIVPVSFSGTITPGDVELVADGSGGVKEPATAGAGTVYHILNVDDTNKILYADLG